MQYYPAGMHWRAALVLMVAVALHAAPALGQQGNAPPPVASLKQAFDSAWQRQPEARAAAARRDSARARREAADSLFPEPPSAIVAAKTDQITRNQGTREYEAGIAMPLWLPGERARTQGVADAELRALDSRAVAAQLRVAASVRDAYWNTQRAVVEADLAQGRLANAEALARDVARRVAAGDLARADQHQAESAAALAATQVAEAQGALIQARQQLIVVTGVPVSVPRDAAREPVPGRELDERHPALRDLADRLEVARRARELAGVQRRANPEVSVGASRERGALGEGYSNAVTLGLRFPFGSDSRSRARIAAAAAEEIEAETQLVLEGDRIVAGIAGARARLESARLQRAAAERRATLTRETRGFFEKSFALGESDLPTRLRVELEAFEAERHLGRVRIEEATAISQLRQSLGLLPE
jgi:cobalt-zinc-cadmium efflux system outer membrane protein